jgi:hypothetical protein
MSLSERLELDIENQGNPIASWLVRLSSRLSNGSPSAQDEVIPGSSPLRRIA